MGDRQMQRYRQPEPEAGRWYEACFSAREEFVKRQEQSPLVIKGKGQNWEMSRQGLLRYYIHHYLDNHPLNDWLVFQHDIKTHSGKHTHQGGLILFVLEGKGTTTCDDQTVDWEKGDIILLPLKPDGCTHQHFNREEGKPAKWMAYINVPFWNESGAEMTQRELNPEWERKYGSTVPGL